MTARAQTASGADRTHGYKIGDLLRAPRPSMGCESLDGFIRLNQTTERIDDPAALVKQYGCFRIEPGQRVRVMDVLPRFPAELLRPSIIVLTPMDSNAPVVFSDADDFVLWDRVVEPAGVVTRRPAP